MSFGEEEEEGEEDEEEEEAIATAKRIYVCGECIKSFSGKYSRDIHCRKVHKIFCEQCDKVFPSFKDLEKHRDAKHNT